MKKQHESMLYKPAIESYQEKVHLNLDPLPVGNLEMTLNM